jgi:hypothetical protein
MNRDERPKEAKTMLGYKCILKRSFTWRHASVVLAALSIAVVVLVSPIFAQEPGQKVFGSPEEALKALAETARDNDKKGMMAILGPGGKEIISSGDETADRNAMEQFVKNYEEKADFVKEKEDRVSVIIGNDNWPFPIPIAKKGEAWVFDTKAGREEVLNRRLGRNELNVIQVCLAYVDAQREYANTDRERDGIIQYARKIWSDPNRRNGLYWEAAEGEAPSPFGPLIAQAAAKGYTKKGGKPAPYYGYYFKILQGQGPNAPGGAYSYVINGHMVAGFAFMAWPAEYGVSGVMTFLVNQNGTVFQKNLGPKTGEAVKTMTRYNPDRTWQRAQ